MVAETVGAPGHRTSKYMFAALMEAAPPRAGTALRAAHYTSQRPARTPPAARTLGPTTPGPSNVAQSRFRVSRMAGRRLRPTAAGTAQAGIELNSQHDRGGTQLPKTRGGGLPGPRPPPPTDNNSQRPERRALSSSPSSPRADPHPSGFAGLRPVDWRLPGRSPRFERPGDVVLGGSFSVLHFHDVAQLNFTVPPTGLPSSGVSSWGYRVAQSFVLAVEDINRGTHLPPTLTLGFSTRNSGDSVHGALHETMASLTGQEDPVPTCACHLGPRAARVGDTRSALSVAMARLLRLYKFPQVSYASTLPSLSDKTQFPSFLRTPASDRTSSHAATQLVLHLGWSWIVILAPDDDFGQQAGALAARELGEADTCIEFHLPVPSQHSPEKISTVLQKMQVSTATGVLVFLNDSNFKLILQSLLGFRLLGQVWVSEGLLHAALALAMPGISRVLRGAFGLLCHRSRVHGFPEFFASLHPSRTPEDMFLVRFWEATFGCRWLYGNGTVSRDVQLCSGSENLRGHEHPFQEVSRVDIAYTAVCSVAHALQDLVSSPSPLRKVRFQTSDGTHILFDANGDLVTKFGILQGQQSPEGQFHFVHIGTMHPHPSSEDRMAIRLKDSVEVPSSVCSTSCEPGSSPIPRQGAPHCCFECRPCPEGQFEDQRDMKSRLQCPAEQSPSRAGDRCVPRTEPFPASDEPLGLALTLAALAPASLAGLVFGSLLRFRHTAVVRAINRALSDTLLPLTLCALCPLLFLGRPSPTTRLLRQTTFAVLFTVAMSCVLAKTLTVVLAFRVTRPGQGTHTPKAQCLLVFSLMQVILCGVWLGTSPPFPQKDATSEPGRLVLQCQEGSGVAFSCMLGYLGLLAIGPSSVAFLARGLPDAFSETKFLAFSLLLLRSVWTAFLPLYRSAGKATVAVEVVSVLACTAGLLGGIFRPKCYLVLLKPEQNSLARLRSCSPHVAPQAAGPPQSSLPHPSTSDKSPELRTGASCEALLHCPQQRPSMAQGLPDTQTSSPVWTQTPTGLCAPKPLNPTSPDTYSMSGPPSWGPPGSCF
ncbi:LOW QUALITY PROTEIN: vomeronasal type-2 receptor 26-like [Erethizon dorsatum]